MILLFVLLVAPQQGISHAEFSTSDGGGGGVELVQDVNRGVGGSSPNWLTPVGNALFFSADDSVYGNELWISVPPYTSARMVADINPGVGSSYPSGIAAVGSTVFFSANDGKNGYELWRSDPPYNQFSTFQLQDINPDGDASPQDMVAIGAGLFFQANNGADGFELWKTEPPYHVAFQVADIYPGSGGSNPYELTPVGWYLFFIARGWFGEELWMTQPPYDVSSTRRVVDLYPGGNAYPGELTPIGNTLFFRANDGVRGYELWKIEPPYDETTLSIVNDTTKPPSAEKTAFNPKGAYPSQLTALGDTLFFVANVNTIGNELWKSVPPYTLTSTSRVEDINLTPLPAPFQFFTAGSDPQDLTPVGSTLFFSADDGVWGRELWQTDPPYSHAGMAVEIRAGAQGSNPEKLVSIGSTLFFRANDGKVGIELWKLDPPYKEAVLVRDLRRGSSGSFPDLFQPIQRTLFFRASNESNGNEVWRYHADLRVPSTGFKRGQVTSLALQPSEKLYANIGDIILEIPKTGLSIPVIGVPITADGWDLSWLWRQAGYLTGTAFPTTPGNTVITAHLYLPDGSPGPFVDLHQLRWGDRVLLHAWGKQYVYEVRSTEVVLPEDSRVWLSEELDWVTLITCQTYDEASASYRQRLVVRAVLITVQDEAVLSQPAE